MSELRLKQVRFGTFMRYVTPSITMMVFMSLYTIVDGAFVAAYVGSDALAGLNIAYPLNNVILGTGIMFATGSSAVVANMLGAGHHRKAEEKFTLSLAAAFVCSLFLGGVMLFFFKPLLYLLGADETVYQYAFDYGLICVLAAPITVMKEILVSYLRVDGQPKLSLYATIIGGVTNILLDYVFIKVFGWGVLGASLATAIGIALGGAIALSYFLSARAGLRFRRFAVDFSTVGKMMYNGSSEMVNQLAAGVVTLLFNLIAMHYYGADGVAAVTIVAYAEFIFISLFLGLSMGFAPLVSYYYGAEEYETNQKLMRYTVIFVTLASIVLFCICHFIPESILVFFTKEGTAVYTMAKLGLELFAFSILLSGFNLVTSGLFTALGNGLVSAVIAFSRTFLLQIGALLILPRFFGFEGIWLAIPLAEVLTFVLVLVFLKKYRSRYILW